MTTASIPPGIVRRELLYDGWYRLHRLAVRMPCGQLVERHLIDNGSAAAVLPFDPDRRTALLIHQPRAAVLDAGEPPLLEAIAGGLGKDTPADCIRKEALEEAGLRLGELHPIANIWPIPPVSTERVQLYLAEYRQADIVAAGGGAQDELEHITVVEIGLDALRDLARSGELTDAKTLILAQALMLERPELWP